MSAYDKEQTAIAIADSEFKGEQLKRYREQILTLIIALEPLAAQPCAGPGICPRAARWPDDCVHMRAKEALALKDLLPGDQKLLIARVS